MSWFPPFGWDPDASADAAVPAGSAPDVAPVDHPRGRAWLVLAVVAGLLAIYLLLIGYFLGSHTVTRYEQAEPGRPATSSIGEFTLTSLTRVRGIPDGNGEFDDAKPGSAYLLATLQVTPRDEEFLSLACLLPLLADDGRTWDADFKSTVDPQREDSDYCDALQVGRETTVWVAYEIPASDVGRVLGIVITRNDGRVDPVLRPPA